MNRELLELRVQLGKDRTVVKNRIHALMAKNGVKHKFSGDSEETAQGNILHVVQKRELQI
ncbi:MAG: hypothetical protein N2V75_11275 [Methanophagales archaeon]|nr:hypothetical protein [Methanophagales archaeon]